MVGMIVQGNALHIPLKSKSVQCVVTSPPYWGLRAYAGVEPSVWGGLPDCRHERATTTKRTEIGKGNWAQGTNGRGELQDGGCAEKRKPIEASSTSGFCSHCGAWLGCLGLEPTPDLYISNMLEVFAEVWRVLRDDGTLWLNMGDSYNASPGQRTEHDKAGWKQASNRGSCETASRSSPGLKPKDMVGMPWRLAFALQAAGWYLRSDIIWEKPNPMPGSYEDRPTTSHEYLFLLTKKARYYYDAEAIAEPCEPESWHSSDFRRERNAVIHPSVGTGDRDARKTTRNKRSVWRVPTQGYSEAHFATFPEKLIKPCILAGTSEKGCCAVCGAPRKRMVERKGGTIGESWHDHSGDGVRGARINPILQDASHGRHGQEPYSVKTIGWADGCEHGAESVPCKVFDPFSGSGTTVKVAQDFGRIGVGLELSSEYLPLSIRRSAQQGMAL